MTILLLLFARINAQTVTNYKVKDGLPSNYVYKLMQDRKGFIWAATVNGIVKFDGKTFKTFSIKDGLPTNNIWEIKITDDDKVWFFSKNKQQGYIENDIVHSFSSVDGITLFPRILYQKKNSVSFMSNNSIYELIDKKWRIKRIIKLNADFVGYTKHKFLLLIENQLVFKNVDGSTIKKINLTPDLANFRVQVNDSISVIVRDKSFVMANINSGKTYTGYFKDYTKNNKVGVVRALYINNQIQICGKGFVAAFNNQFDLVNKVHIPSSINQYNGLIDKNNNIWTNHLGEGIHFINQSQHNLNTIFKGLNIEKIKIIDDKLLVGEHNKGLYSYDIINKKSKKLFETKGYIRKIMESKELKENIAITERNAYYFDDNSTEIIKFYSKLNQSFISVAKAFLYHNHQYFIATSSHFHVFDSNKKEIFATQQDGLECIYQRDGEIYLCSNDGLKVFKNNKILSYSDTKDISQYTVNIIENYNNKYAMAGTGGLGIFLFNKNELHPINVTNGLNVYGAAIDKNNKVWLSTDKGVYKIKVDDNNPQNSILEDVYTTSDGLPTNDVNEIEAYDTTVFVASYKGVSTLNIKKQNRHKPNIYISNISSKGALIGKDSVQIKFNKTDPLKVNFGVIDFQFQNNLSYYYKLLPNEKDWNKINSTEINLNALEPGIYDLQIKVLNHHQQFATKSVFIKIKPLWYQTLLFRLLAYLFGSMIIYFFIQRYLKQEKLKIENKEKVLSQVTKLELKALRSQMNPHFVFNSINAIQYYLNMNDIDQTEKYLLKFAELIRRFLDYSSVQSLSLNQEIDLLNRYLEIEKLRFGEKLSYTITTDKKINTNDVFIPSMLLQPIVENSVNHGVFHLKKDGNINIDFKFTNNNTFEVIINDNGVGRDKSAEIQKKSLKNYESKSTSILEDRIYLLKQSKEFEIQYLVTDKPNNSGTIVQLIIKNTQK